MAKRTSAGAQPAPAGDPNIDAPAPDDIFGGDVTPAAQAPVKKAKAAKPAKDQAEVEAARKQEAERQVLIKTPEGLTDRTDTLVKVVEARVLTLGSGKRIDVRLIPLEADKDHALGMMDGDPWLDAIGHLKSPGGWDEQRAHLEAVLCNTDHVWIAGNRQFYNAAYFGEHRRANATAAQAARRKAEGVQPDPVVAAAVSEAAVLTENELAEDADERERGMGVPANAPVTTPAPKRTRAPKDEPEVVKAKAAKPPKAPPAKAAAPVSKDGKVPSKNEQAIAMVKAKGGASSKEIEAATGLVSHSVRRMVSVSKAKGAPITATKDAERGTVYRWATEA